MWDRSFQLSCLLLVLLHRRNETIRVRKSGGPWPPQLVSRTTFLWLLMSTQELPQVVVLTQWGWAPRGRSAMCGDTSGGPCWGLNLNAAKPPGEHRIAPHVTEAPGPTHQQYCSALRAPQSSPPRSFLETQSGFRVAMDLVVEGLPSWWVEGCNHSRSSSCHPEPHRAGTLVTKVGRTRMLPVSLVEGQTWCCFGQERRREGGPCGWRLSTEVVPT